MKFCPHCGGDLAPYLAAAGGVVPSTVAPAAAAKPYDQTGVWKDLVELARDRVAKSSVPGLAELVDAAITELFQSANPATNVNGLSTVVHLVFDRPIVPRGGIIRQAVQADGKLPSLEPKHLEAVGYLVLNGKVVQDENGVPVGPAYGAITYWGGDKQFNRWHLAQPVEVSASRNGDPFFMDEEMVAFGAVWRDMGKIRDAMLALLMTLRDGVQGDKPIATAVALKMTQRR